MIVPTSPPEITGPVLFHFLVSRRDREVALVWTAETGFSNVSWERWLDFRLGWPPIRFFEGFLPND